jgi:hypothetical protein
VGGELREISARLRKIPHSAAWSASSPTSTLVQLEALIFAAGYYALTVKWSKSSGNNRVAAFAGAVVAIQHDPVSSLASPVRSRRVREQCGVPAGTAARVEDRQPRFVHRVESPWRDSLQLFRSRFLTVLAIDVEQFGDPWTANTPRRELHAAEAMGKRVPNTGETFRTEPGERFQSAVVCGSLEIRQRLETELVVEPLGQYTSNTWNGGEQGNRIGLTAKPIEHRQTSVSQKLTNGAGDGLADARQRAQAVDPTGTKDLIDWL